MEILGTPSAAHEEDVFTFDRKSLLSILSLIPREILGSGGSSTDLLSLKLHDAAQSPSSRPAVDGRQAAKALYRARRRRDFIMGKNVFADPAWDMLLDLYAAEGDGQQICISSACIAGNVPYSTALRSLRDLEERRLIHRIRDQGDRRRIYVALTDHCRIALADILSELGRNIIPG